MVEQVMYGSSGSNSALDEILERARRRRNELDAEYEEAAAAIRDEIAERERALEEQQAEFDRREAERKEAEQAAARERARKEQISVGEQDEDPFADQEPKSWGPRPEPQVAAESQHRAQTQPQQIGRAHV